MREVIKEFSKIIFQEVIIAISIPSPGMCLLCTHAHMPLRAELRFTVKRILFLYPKSKGRRTVYEFYEWRSSGV